jgi:hypothetical protein
MLISMYDESLEPSIKGIVFQGTINGFYTISNKEGVGSEMITWMSSLRYISKTEGSILLSVTRKSISDNPE